jgi:hypothetical protein
LDLADALLDLEPSLATIQVFAALESETTNFQVKVTVWLYAAFRLRT